LFPGTFAALTPDKAAVVMSDSGALLTYTELDERSTRLARAFRDAGLRTGDGVALLAENMVEFHVVYWAAMRSGLYFTPIDHHLTTPEIAHIVDDCEARALIVSTTFAEVAAELLDRTPHVTFRLAVGGPLQAHAEFSAAIAAVPPEPLPDQPRGAELLYSSGTTGRPKGITMPMPGEQVDRHRNPVHRLFGGRYGIDADTVYLSPAPLYHTAPMRFTGMVHEVGGTVVVMPRFDAAAALEAIERYGVTHSQWVPTMFVRMLKLPDEKRLTHDLSSHRVAIHAAAPCAAEVKRKMIEWWGPILEEYYSGSEGLGLTMIDSATWPHKPGSVGRAVLGVLHVCDDHGNELPPGQVGLVYFERNQFPFAYHNDPERTRQARHPQHENWGTTGDIGYVDEDGFLFLTDRTDFTIISGGVNIYPQEVEDALTLHPAVLDLAVFGLPDPDMGEQVVAVVQPAPGVTTGPELERELLTYLRERIAHYKVPRRIDFVAELPRAATGKMRKHTLREKYALTP
jgi:long-chain acyl-CoA synthetase